jgi:hypothetical protein
MFQEGDLGSATAMGLRAASKMAGNVLEQAAAQGHIEHLLPPADAEDGQSQAPSLADDGDLQGIPPRVHLCAGVKPFSGVPPFRVDIASAHDEETRAGVQGWHWVSWTQRRDVLVPASPSKGRDVMLL